MALWHLVLSSLKRQRTLYVVWIIALTLSLTGVLLVDLYRQSLTSSIHRTGQELLSADVTLSVRRQMTSDEIAKFQQALPKTTRFARLTEMFAMVTGQKRTRLALIRFIDQSFPLYGTLERSNSTNGAWVAPDLLTLMNLKLGDKIKIGNIELPIAGVVTHDSSQTFRLGNMAPRVYVDLSLLQKTGLIQFGSTFSETLLAADPHISRNPMTVKKNLESTFSDPSFQISVPADLESGTLAGLGRMLDFLGLIGLVTLALGWIGVYYLGRQWLSFEEATVDLLRRLGLTSNQLLTLLLTQLILVLTLGVLASSAVSWFFSSALLPYLKALLPSGFILTWSWQTTLLSILLGPVAGWLLLFSDCLKTAKGRAHQISVLFFLSVFSLFALVTYTQARSFQITLTFLLILFGSAIALAAISIGFLWLVRLKHHCWVSWLPHLASALWLRRPKTSVLLITIAGLSGILSQLIPHIEKTLFSSLTESTTARPALFLVDIQDDQLEPLAQFLADHHITISQRSPFIRARLLSVNNQDFERGSVGSWSTREDQMAARMRNRGMNLTYRDQLSESENIVSEKSYSELKPDEVAIESNYASRLGIKIGDELLFDVQGLEVKVHVASLRKIAWDSFQPNFFIQFRSGLLDQAPKTWIMTLEKPNQLSSAEVQLLLADNFANVTSINVEDTVSEISQLLHRAARGLKVASYLSLGLGLFVFALVLTFQITTAAKDRRELLVLGLTHHQLLRFQLLAFAGLAFLGSCFGAVLSFGAAWSLGYFALKTSASFDLLTTLNNLAFSWSFALMAVWLIQMFSRRAFARM